jgi:hypothetical protein
MKIKVYGYAADQGQRISEVSYCGHCRVVALFLNCGDLVQHQDLDIWLLLGSRTFVVHDRCEFVAVSCGHADNGVVLALLEVHVVDGHR